MNGEVIYFCLMLLGWCFLAGLALALVAACAVVFREIPAENQMEGHRHPVVFKSARSRLT